MNCKSLYILLEKKKGKSRITAAPRRRLFCRSGLIGQKTAKGHAQRRGAFCCSKYIPAWALKAAGALRLSAACQAAKLRSLLCTQRGKAPFAVLLGPLPRKRYSGGASGRHDEFFSLPDTCLVIQNLYQSCIHRCYRCRYHCR